MSYEKLDKTKELSFRSYIVQTVEQYITIPTFKSLWYFNSAQDFLSTEDEEMANNKPISYFMLGFGNFANTKKGCEDNPDVFVYYRAQMFQRYFQSDSQASNSHDVLVANLCDLRNGFLRTLELNVPSQQLRLKQLGEITRFQPCEHIVGVFGDWVNFQIEVEVT